VSVGDHQGEQDADDRSGYQPEAHGENPGKDRCLQGRVETTRDRVCDRVSLALLRYRSRPGVKVLQRQEEAEHASSQGAAAKYELA
jgi:hypothetical protein